LDDGARLRAAAEMLLTPQRQKTSVSSFRYERSDAFDSAAGSVAYWSSGTGAPVLLVQR